MKHGYLYISVSISGASVLAVEILGTRILGPFCGVSLFLWSALITVTLAALALGYALGGRWADKGATMRRLSFLLAGAGIWLILVPWIKHPLLKVAEPFGLRFAALAAAMVLFFIPLMLLGMVSPYAVKLRASSLEDVGRSAGNLYAAATAASLAAALLTGFVLIPLVGVGRLVFLIGVVLVVTALIGAVLKRAGRGPATIIIVIAVAAAIFVAPQGRRALDSGIVAITQSPYAEIRVVDVGDLRLMLVDGMIREEVDAKTLEPRSSCIDVLDLAAGFRASSRRMLLVGLGAGSVARRFAENGWKVDAAEIDPAVERIARDYFGLKPSHAHVYHMDGREFLTEHDDMYDLIIVDVFASGSIPFHLVTKEAFARCKARLAPDGVLALNVSAVGWRDKLVRSLAATLSEEFARVIVLPIAEPPDQLGNLILLASNGSLELAWEPPVPKDRFSPEYNRAHAWDNRFEIDPSGEQVITDDLSPADLWAEHINLANRKALHEHFRASGIGW